MGDNMGSLVKEYTKEKLTGQVFTPFFIVEKILDDIGYYSSKILGKKVLDPACGDGRFLVKVAERIIKYSPPDELEKNLSFVYGWDIDEEVTEMAIRNLDELIRPYGISVEWNISAGNSLHKGNIKYDLMNWAPVEKFDYIVGNPPYIRIQHLDENEREYIKRNYKFCNTGSTDIYIAFYELAINLLNEEGVCGFITPNTFFHTATAKKLRQYFARHKNLRQISNYGHIQLFDNATTYSAVVIFDKKKHDGFLYQQAKSKTSFKERFINFSELGHSTFWQLSVEPLGRKKGVRLGDIAKIHVGITTLADKIYIMPYVKQDGDFIYLRAKSGNVVMFEREALKPIVKVSTLKSADEPIKEYIVFPYENVSGVYKIMPEIKLKNKYPLTYNYLLSVKDILEKRDNGKPNPVAWYAFGRSQGLNTSFGEKILFSPMNKKPNFIYYPHADVTFYSGYCIKYGGDYEKLLTQLNSKRMEEFIKISSRDFRSGWKAYNKKIVQEFMIYEELEREKTSSFDGF